MKLPKGDVLIYVVLMLGAGVYLLIGWPSARADFKPLLAVVAGLCLLTGLSLFAHFRWSPEMFLLVILILLVSNVVWAFTDGLSAKRFVSLVACICAGFGYLTLRREVRQIPRAATDGCE